MEPKVDTVKMLRNAELNILDSLDRITKKLRAIDTTLTVILMVLSVMLGVIFTL
jgi:hypothetical protein